MQRCCCRTWPGLKTTDLRQLFELLCMMMQRCRHYFSAMAATICCSILPYNNSLAKLNISCNGGTGWPWTYARKTSALQPLHPQIAVRSWCSRGWMRSSSVISALRSVRSWVFLLSNYPRFFCVNSRTVWTSSACRRSSALKQDIALRSLPFLLARSVSETSSGITLLQHKPKYVPSCALTLLSPLYIVLLTQ